MVTPEIAIQNEVLKNGGVYQSITNNYAGTQITALAAVASVSIVFANADSGEGFVVVDGNVGDRNNLTLWNGMDTVVRNVSANCNNTILVIHSTGPVAIEEYKDNPNVTAILWAGLPGQESGNAITDVLYGRVNPGAKLPFSIASTRQDYGTDILYKPNNGGEAPQVAFTEGIFIDYRSLDQRKIEPVYEFGYGLSYTNFSYSNLDISPVGTNEYSATTGNTSAAPTYGNSSTKPQDYQFPRNFRALTGFIYPYLNGTNLTTAANTTGFGDESFIPEEALDGSPQPKIGSGGAPGGNAQLYDILYRVRASLTNTGKVAGDEIVQLYVALGGEHDPPKVLRGFQRLRTQPGETVTFTADLTRRDLSNWDTATQNWVIRDTTKTVYVGSSSRKLPLSGRLSGNDYGTS